LRKKKVGDLSLGEVPSNQKFSQGGGTEFYTTWGDAIWRNKEALKKGNKKRPFFPQKSLPRGGGMKTFLSRQVMQKFARGGGVCQSGSRGGVFLGGGRAAGKRKKKFLSQATLGGGGERPRRKKGPAPWGACLGGTGRGVKRAKNRGVDKENTPEAERGQIVSGAAKDACPEQRPGGKKRTSRPEPEPGKGKGGFRIEQRKGFRPTQEPRTRPGENECQKKRVTRETFLRRPKTWGGTGILLDTNCRP